MAAAKKKTAAKKSAAKKSAAKKAAKKTAATTKRASSGTKAVKKSAATKSATKKSAAKKSATKKAAAKKSAAKKAAASAKRSSAPAKKSTTKPAASARNATVKKSASTKAPAKKSAAKKSGASKRPRPSSVTSPLLSNDQPDVIEIPKPRGTTKDGIAYTKDFDVKFLKVQRDELLARRDSELRRATRLEDEAESLIENGEMGDVQFDDEGGEGDTMVVQRDLDRVLSSQARAAVEEIDAALGRIENGTYGYSVVSGQPIPRERLEALPETTMLATEKISGIGR